MIDLPGISDEELPGLLKQADDRSVLKPALSLFIRMCPRGPYKLRVRKLIRNHLLDYDDLNAALDSLQRHIENQESIPPEYANFREELAKFLIRYVPYVLGPGEKTADLKDVGAWVKSASH
jgi:hypothetical protein